MGVNYLADVLVEAAAKARGRGSDLRGLTIEQWRDAVAEALLPRLEASDEQARALRGEVSQLPRAVDAVGTALTESAEGTQELRQDLAVAMVALGAGVDDLRWMLTESVRALRTR